MFQTKILDSIKLLRASNFFCTCSKSSGRCSTSKSHPYFFLFEKKAIIFVFMLQNRYCRTKLRKIAQNEAIWILEMTHNYKMSLKKEVAHARYTVSVSNFDVQTLWYIFSPSHLSFNFFNSFFTDFKLGAQSFFFKAT